MNQQEPNPMNQVAPVPPKEPVISPGLLVTFIIVVLAGAGYFAWNYISKSKIPETTTPAPVTTSTTSGAKPTTTIVPLTYTNSDYGFDLTFPTSWKGYKMKGVDITGAAKVYYCNFPTTDTSIMTDESTDDGYFAPFAIGVYTLAQWAEIEAADGPKPKVLAQNNTYVFTGSQANGIPPTDFKGQGDIGDIFDSFTLK